MTDWTQGYVADIGYTHGYYRELSPAQQAFALAMQGFRPPRIDGDFAYAELGCGQGVSATIHAAANPGRYYATDFNPSQIAGAQQRADRAKVGNLTLADDSFAEFADADLPPLDAIGLHGIYSWISPESRRDIVQFIRRRLKPGGVVYISYNALPGWSAYMPLREVLSRAGTGSSLQRAETGIALLQQLVDTKTRYAAAVPGVAERIKGIQGHPRSYIAHEYLNRHWTPFYHADVAAELAEAKLEFAASAYVMDGIDAVSITAEQATMLRGIADPAWRQTMRDFCTNQQFRRDLFVRGPTRMSAIEQQALLNETRFVLLQPRAGVELKVKAPIGEVSLKEEVYNPILDLLANGPVTLGEIEAKTRSPDRSYAQTLQGISILIGANILSPALPAAGEAQRRAVTDRLNGEFLQESTTRNDVHFLASPVTGGGIPADHVTRLLLAGFKRKEADLSQFVWTMLSRAGQRLMREGKPVESPEENVAEIRKQEAKFQAEQLPLFRQLGVA